MPAASNTLRISIFVDDREAMARVKGFNRSLDGIGIQGRKAGKAAAGGMDALTGSMGRSVVQAGLLGSALYMVSAAVKALTIDTALYAARIETLGVVVDSMSRVNNINVDAVRAQTLAIQRLGITTKESREIVAKMIFTQIDLGKATQLARMSQDAAVIAQLNSSEAFAQIIHGIVSGRVQVLRMVGINVSFEESYRRLARALGVVQTELTQTQKIQARTNEVLRVAYRLTGTYEAAMETAGKQLASLRRYIDEAKRSIGEHFLPELRLLIALFKDVAILAEESGAGIAILTKSVIALGVAFASYKIATIIIAITASLKGMTGVAALNPFGLIAGGVTLLGAAVYKQKVQLEEYADSFTKTVKRAKLLEQINMGRSMKQLEALGYTVKDLRENVFETADAWRQMTAATGTSTISLEELDKGADKLRELRREVKSLSDAQLAAREAEVQGFRKVYNLREGIEELKTIRFGLGAEGYDFSAHIKATIATEVAERARAKALKDRDSAEKVAHTFLLKAQESEYGGLHKILFEREKMLKQYGLSLKAIQEINEATEINIGKELRRLGIAQRKRATIFVDEDRKLRSKTLEADTERWRKRQEYERETLELHVDTLDSAFEYEREMLEQARAERLRHLDMITTWTLRDKLAVEHKKGEIEADYLLQEAARYAEALNRRMKMEIGFLEQKRDLQILMIAEARKVGKLALAREMSEMADLLKQQIGAIIAAAGEEGRQLDARWIADTKRVREQAAIEQANIILDHNRRVFDSIKRSAEGVFDALLVKSSSVFEAIANALKTAVLTALKEIVTSQIALMFMQLMGGRGFGGGGGGFGGRGAGGRGGGLLAALGGVGAIVGGPGGTGGFAGPVGGGGGGFGGGGFGGGYKEYGGFLSQLGNIGFQPERWSMSSSGEMTKLAGARGVGGMKGGAMLMGGGILAMEGLRRGGKAGLAMTTAGGALIGAKFGGPIGALIGAGIGAIAGTIRLFIKGAQQKVINKVQTLYGITITKQFAKDPLLGIIKQQFGGNIEVGIRSPAIRDLLELYAMSTGQPIGGVFGGYQPVSITQSGGVLSRITAPLPGTALGGSAQAMPQMGTQPVAVLDSAATKEFWRGVVEDGVVQAPRKVQEAALMAQQQNVGRGRQVALQFAPGLVPG